MSYKEIEIEVIGRGSEKVKYSFNVDNISHYKQYVAGEYDKKDAVVTMVYLKGNPQVLRLNCGYDTFKKKLGSVVDSLEATRIVEEGRIIDDG